MMRVSKPLINRRCPMPFNSIEMIREVRADFEKLLELVTGAEARIATVV